jgi:hypothetical protein
LLPIYADKSLKYGVGLALLLVILISVWSWRTLRQATMAPPLPSVQISGSAHPIAVSTIGTTTTSDTPDNRGAGTSRHQGGGGESTAENSVAAPQASAPQTTSPSLGMAQGGQPASPARTPAATESAALPQPEKHTLLDGILSTVLSLL